MMFSSTRALSAALVAASVLAFAGSAGAQDSSRSPGFLDNLFGGNSAPPPSAVQSSEARAAELAVQVDRLQAQVRTLTGQVEQLQFRNQQLEQQIQRMGGTADPRVAAPANAMPPVSAPQSAAALPPPVTPVPAPSAPQSDVFDPSQHPDAPGVPRVLGGMPAGRVPAQSAPPPAAVPAGQPIGAPLDLSTLSGPPGSAPVPSAPGVPPQPAAPAAPMQSGNAGLLPPPPPRNTSATGAQTALVQPPTQTPKDEFDLAYGYMQRKDYAQAENELRDFLRRYPSDSRAPDAQYWLGESLFQRHLYNAAGKAFLEVTTKYEGHGKAPEALLRLGQSLAAVGEKEAACAAWNEIGRKYKRAPASVKQSIAAEQKRVHC